MSQPWEPLGYFCEKHGLVSRGMPACACVRDDDEPWKDEPKDSPFHVAETPTDAVLLRGKNGRVAGFFVPERMS